MCDTGQSIGVATLESVNTLGDAASTAIAAGDWATALTKALAAQAQLSVMPDSEYGNPQTVLRYDRRAIESMIGNILRQQAAATGMQQTKITYARPTDS